MEIRLIKIIAIPGMILTFLLGIILLKYQSYLIYEIYFIIKLPFATVFFNEPLAATTLRG